jgi:hypothetical protein
MSNGGCAARGQIGRPGFRQDDFNVLGRVYSMIVFFKSAKIIHLALGFGQWMANS